MALELVESIARYQGAAADKPASAVIGSTFYETDTGKNYIYAAAGWVEVYDNATGKQDDAVYAGGATATIISALKGLYAKLAATLTVQLTGSRGTGALHRDAITATDKIADFVDASVTLADNGAGTGSLAASTTFYATAIPGNRWGPCKVNTTIDSLASAAYGGATGSYRMTIAQATGAEWYDIFLSTDAAPKWVGRITEAQRAAGDFEITAVGTVAAGGGNPAGTVDVNLVGTGIQTSNAVFAQNNAYRPATVTAIDCTGKLKAIVHVKLALTDLRSAPTLSLVPFFRNASSTSEWHQGARTVVQVLGGLGQALEQIFEIDVQAASALVILIGEITGQGAAASVWVELI